MKEISQYPSRPTKITWNFPEIHEGEDWKMRMPSKSVRQLVSQMDHILEKAGIICRVELANSDIYDDWLAYYSKTMLSQNHDVIADRAWFDKKMELGETVIMIEFRKKDIDQRVGASMILRRNDISFVHVFRASDRLHIAGDPNTSLGILLDIEYIRYAVSQGATKIGAGTSRNAFGKFNTVGYIGSKLKMGYLPSPSPLWPYDQELPRKDETSLHAWFVQKSENAQLELILFPNQEAF